MGFISLSDVIDAIASFVPIPDDWGGGYLQTVADTPSYVSFRMSMFNLFMNKVYCTSEAAAILDQHIHNASVKRPRWFDIGQTGRPKLGEAAHGEAMAILVHMANWFGRYDKAYRFDRIPWWVSNGLKNYEGKFNSRDASRRAEEIGFDRTEIVNFLKLNGVSHSLRCEVLPEENIKVESNKKNDVIDSLSIVDLPVFTVKPETNTKAAVTQTTGDLLANPRVTHSTKSRRNILDTLLDDAIKLAGSDKTDAIFLQLKQMALDERPPFTGMIEGNSLIYTNHNNKKDTLTYGKLSARLSRRRKHKSLVQ